MRVAQLLVHLVSYFWPNNEVKQEVRAPFLKLTLRVAEDENMNLYNRAIIYIWVMENLYKGSYSIFL